MDADTPVPPLNDALARMLLERGPNGMFLCERGVITFANPAGLRLLRANHAGEVVGRRATDLLRDASWPG